jgi:hypothetical protein
MILLEKYFKIDQINRKKYCNYLMLVFEIIVFKCYGIKAPHKKKNTLFCPFYLSVQQ